MALGRFIRNIFGGDKTVTFSDDPFGSQKVPPPTVKAESVPQPRCVVQRDEILDARSRIAGYRFVVRRFGSTLTPTVAETAAALRAENVAAFAERRLVLLPVTAEDCLRAEFRQFIAPNAYFLVASPSADQDPAAWRQVLETFKAGGARIAIEGAALADRAALDLADLCLLDFRGHSLEHFERLLRRLARGAKPLPVAVDNLGAWAEHRLCMDRHATYSLGGFAAGSDEDEAKDQINQSRLVLIEMLNLLRQDADLAEIALVAKRDPGVAVKVVSMANTPMLGLSAPVASLDQAMMVLGRETLYRWLSVSLFRAGSSNGRDETLLEMALWRARFLELLATGARPKSECDELFLVGLFSLLDSLLGIPMAQVVRRMTLPEPVMAVLLDSSGPYGRYLSLALVAGRGGVEQAERLAGELGVDVGTLENAARAARLWSEEALGAT